MKLIWRWLIVLLFSFSFASAADSDATSSTATKSTAETRLGQPIARSSTPEWQAKLREEHQTVWQSVRHITNAMTGSVRATTNSYIEIGTGLNRRDAAGNWQPSSPVFQITATGAEANLASHHVTLSANINTAGAVQIEKDGVKMQGHPLCIAYYDPVDGRSELIAELTDATGWLVTSNEIVFSNCFKGLSASIRYRNSVAGLEQDLLLHERPAFTPQDIGFSDKARLELFTEWIGDTPVPEKTTRPLLSEKDTVSRRQMVEPDFTDATLTFGEGKLRMAHGRAFSTGDRSTGSTNQQSKTGFFPVGKRFEIIDGRRILIEALPVRQVQPMLNQLPVARLSGAVTNAATRNPSNTNAVQMATAVARPTSPAVFTRPLPQKRLAQIKSDAGIQTAASGSNLPIDNPQSEFAVVLDWQLLSGGTQDNYTFYGTNTYHVTAPVNLTGTTRIEGGTVVKFDPWNTSASLQCYGPVVCDTSEYRPAIFTGKDDNSVGEALPGGSGSPAWWYYGGGYLQFFSSSDVNLKHLRAKYSDGSALSFHSSSTHNRISHCQFVYSSGLFADGNSLALLNVLFDNVPLPIEGLYFDAQAEHITARNGWSIADDFGTGGSINLVNSLVVNVAECWVPYTLDQTYWNTADESLFQTVGAGGYYLADNAHRNVGTPNIDAGLKADLARMTTYPPEVLAGTATPNLILGPRSIGDTDVLDRGYHYPTIDYALNSLSVEDTTVLLTNGVVVTPCNWYGFWLKGGELVSEGTPDRPNHILPYTLVQEQSISWNNINPASTTTVYPSPSQTPNKVQLRFTSLDKHQYGDSGYHFYSDPSSVATRFSLQDSEVIGGAIQLWADGGSGSIYGLTNSALQNVHLLFADSPNLFLFNNLVYFSMFEYGRSENSAWLMRDNVFVHSRLYDFCDLLPEHSHNAFAACYYESFTTIDDQMYPPGTGEVVLSELAFQKGTFGNYYLPASETQLTDHGSRNAADAGLFHYTTSTTMGSKEGNDPNPTVDIGIHYAATGAGGKPLDSDSDGIADYLEDKNSNGVTDSGETSFQYSDTDYDGRSDGQELLGDGTDPLNPADGKLVQLGYWRFNDTSWLGEAGQIPLNVAGLGNPSSWSGKSLSVDSSGSANLKYRDVEGGGFANINARRGTVRFWFRPHWTSSTGPGAIGRLIEMGNTANSSDGWWTLSVNATGTELKFQSQINGNLVTYFAQPIDWQAGRWHHIAIAYTNTETKLYLDGVFAASGTGIQSYPTPAARAADGFSIGSNRVCGEQARGEFEELETFNYALSADTIAADYEIISTVDQDLDGLTDIQESEAGSDPLKADTDNDGVSDGAEVNQHGTNPLEVDTDYDGRSDWQEINVDLTTPNNHLSVFQTNLAIFNFDSPSLVGAQGQTPRQVLNVTTVPSWNGMALQVAGPNPARLNYSDIESYGGANINCREGTIQFWFKPNWSSGTGPGHVVRLIEVGDPTNPQDGWWTLSINATGDRIRFEALTNGLSQPRVFFDDVLLDPLTAGQWYLLTLSYYSDVSALYVNDNLSVLGEGVDVFPNSNGRATNGFSIGGNRTGGEQAEGQFEDLKSYNYFMFDGAQSTPIADAYYARISLPLASFSVSVPEFINSSSVLIQVDGALSGSVAWAFGQSINEIPVTPTWLPMQSFEINNLQSGEHHLWIGFKDSSGATRWIRRRVVVDTTSPQVVITAPQITNPAGTVVTTPFIQLQGHAMEKLSRVSYWVVNSSGTTIETEGVVLGDDFGATTTQNVPAPHPGVTHPQVSRPYVRTRFQCYDVDLAIGQNEIHIRAVDLAGNETLQAAVYVLDYSGVTAGPNIISQWPITGAILSGTKFTMRGYLDDPTANIKASVAVNGETVEFGGVVERDGLFWVEDIPLTSGNNNISLTMMNAAGLSSSEAISVTASAPNLSLNAIPDSELTKPYTVVTLANPVPGYSVWVNGVQVAFDSQTSSWNAKVPQNIGGTASFHMTAIPDAEIGGLTPPSSPTVNNVQSANPTSPNAVQSVLDLERPAFIRIKKYEGGAASYSGTWDVCEMFSVLHDDSWTCVWQNGVGGGQNVSLWTEWCNENDEIESGSIRTDVTWDSQGNGSGTSTPPGEVAIPPVPDWPWEYCDLKIDWLVGEEDFHFARGAQSTVELHTGGKSIARRMNLFVVFGGASGRGEDCAGFGGPHPCPNGFYYPIEATRVYIPGLSKSLGNDGRLYAVLADNQIVDVTPKIDRADFYHFTLDVTKHNVKLTANNIGLNENFVVNDAEFCVGQKVELRLQFEPWVSFVRSETAWHLSGKFVNYYEAIIPEQDGSFKRLKTTCHPKQTTFNGYEGIHPRRSTIYSIESQLLEQPETGAWWQSGGEKEAVCLKKLFFSNGQSVSILKHGKFYVVRPSVHVTIPTRGSPTFLPFYDFGFMPVLALGGPRDTSSGTHDMRFNVYYDGIGKFSGDAAVTQLLTADYTWWPSFQFTDWRLDGNDEYYKASANNPLSQSVPEVLRYVAFFDAPENGHLLPVYPVRVKAQYKVYCRFRPSGTDNISVTLGILTWSCHGELGSGGIVTTNSAIAPTNPADNSDEFPFWEKVRGE